MNTETTTNLPPCPLPGCEGGEHHYHDIEVYTPEEHDCARASSLGYHCYSQHRPGLPEPVSLPEITDEMVERATSIFIGSSGYAAPGMRDALTGFRAELLAGGTRWQPIEHDQIRAGMRIRTAVAQGDRITTYTGVAHHADTDGDWLTESDLLLTGIWGNSITYEVDSPTVPDPDAEPVEIIAELLHAGDFRSLDMWGGLTERERQIYRDQAREIVAAVRAHDEAVTGDE